MTVKELIRKIYNSWPCGLLRSSCSILWHKWIIYPINKKKYQGLKKYHNIHKGQRCFIVATGPSLTLEDVDKLKDEICFSMNTVYKLFDHTSWRPQYYAIVDKTVYRRIASDILKIDWNCGFYGDAAFSWAQKNIYPVPLRRNLCSTSMERRIVPSFLQKKRVSEDIAFCAYEGTSVVHFIMQICFYMGFSEVVLLGTDCTNPSQHSSATSYSNLSITDDLAIEIHNGLIADYECERAYAENHGVKIYNATRGGALEVFERVNLDNFLLGKYK